MKLKAITSLSLLFSFFALSACSGSNSSSVTSSDVSIRFSDAPIEALSQVVIKVDQLIFSREGQDDIVVDTFTSEELGIEDADTFVLDLLTVQGNDNRLVLDSVELPVGDYQNFRIGILDEDVNDSFVEETATSLIKPIKVPSDELKLGAFTVAPNNTQTFVVEFGLRQAMTYNPGPDRYILKPRGVRVVRLENASSIEGVVDLDAIHLEAPCFDKVDSAVGNAAYLYAGHELDSSLLGDVFVRQDDSQEVPEFDPNVPEDLIAPIASSSIAWNAEDEVYEYIFSYVNPGDYTVAISCMAEGDDPVMHDDNIVIPAPSDEILEVSLAAETNLACNFPTNGGCAAL